jgi:hypothetical protein
MKSEAFETNELLTHFPDLHVITSNLLLFPPHSGRIVSLGFSAHLLALCVPVAPGYDRK